MKKKILIIVSSADHIGPHNRVTGNLLTEVANPYELFKRQGYDIDIYSVKGGEAPIEMYEENDPLNHAFLTGDGLVKMKNTLSVEEIGSIAEYDAVFVPGGLAPLVDMPDNKTIQKILADMWEKGAVVSAVCHGPVALVNVKLSDGSYLVKGKNVSGFSREEDESYSKDDIPFMLEDVLRERGANYSKVAPLQAYSIADGRLVTGQNPASAKGVGEKVISILESVVS
jgi:putative intracellular protease/amidase